MKSKILVSAFLLVAAGVVDAQVTVSDAWVRATVPAQRATAAFMQIVATDGARLISASSPVAGTTEIHEMAMVDGVMKMRAIPGLDLPAGKTVVLSPGSYHVMLLDLKAPIRVGDAVPLSLVFESPDKRRTTMELKAPVRALTDASGGHRQP